MSLHSRDTAHLQNLIDSSASPIIPKANPLTEDNLWIIERPLMLESHKRIILDGAHLRLADGVYSNIFSTEYPLGGVCQHKENISIIGQNGAILDGGIYNGLSEKNSCKDGLPHIYNNHLIFMRDVDRFEVRGLKIIEPRHWALTFHHCTNGTITDIEFQASNQARNQDGIDLRFGCHDILIENISGATGDDTIALTALNHRPENAFFIPNRTSDIYNITIRNVNAACTGGHGIIRLLCHDGCRVHDILVENIIDRNFEIGKKNHATIRIGDKNYSKIKPAEDSDMYNLTIRRVKTDSPVAILLHGHPQNLTITDIENTNGEILVNTKV